MGQLLRGRSIFDQRASHTIRIHHTEIPAACSSAAYSSSAKTIGLSNTQVRTPPASAITTTVSASFPMTTSSSPECPTADKTTYNATNKPLGDMDSSYLIPNTSLTYRILCYVDFRAESGGTAAVDLQIMNNVTSFKDCLDASALYIFQTPADTLPSLGCTGLLWDSKLLVCWLKSKINQSEATTSQFSLYAAILLS